MPSRVPRSHSRRCCAGSKAHPAKSSLCQIASSTSSREYAPHPGPLPASGAREQTFEFPRPACGERVSVRGFLRRQLLLALAVAVPMALSSCGWIPLYAEIEAGPASEELRAIHVDPIAERIGQRLEMALRSSLNPTGEPTPERYRLRTTLITYLVN